MTPKERAELAYIDIVENYHVGADVGYEHARRIADALRKERRQGTRRQSLCRAPGSRVLQCMESRV